MSIAKCAYSIAGGMPRSIRKFGKRLCFPSAPSSWICRTVEYIQGLQDTRPKSEILFPEPVYVPTTINKEGNNNTNNCDDDDGWYTRPPSRFWGPRDKGHMFWRNKSAVCAFLKSQIPDYTEHVNDLVSTSDSATSIQIGKQFDVVSLLSYCCCDHSSSLYRLNGDTVDIQQLMGKNVMVFCVYVPVFCMSVHASNIRALPLVCNKAFDGDYEVVVVPKLRLNWATDEDAFHHFLSGFPSSWLAIPFSQPLRRDFVCKSLGLTSKFDSMCLFVDYSQKVLLHSPPYEPDDSLLYGNSNCVPWWKSHSQLHAILGCDPSDYVYNINPGNGVLSISELNNKLVGLYLCKNGSFIRTLKLIHQECKSRSMDFEVVLIYLPVCHDQVDPQLFQDAVNYVLHSFKIDNWWVLPHDDFRYHRFKQDRQNFSDDELIIVGPHNEFVDPCGKHVISCFGFDAYPFTREHVVEKEYREIRALTLDDILGDHFLTSVNDLEAMTAQGLRGKTVILYMDNAHSLKHDLYFQLLDWYFHTKRTRKSSDFEVVFIDNEYGDEDEPLDLDMPWLWCSVGPQHSAFVVNRLFKGITDHVLVAFGKDGHILSLDAEHLLQSCDPDGIESYEGLHDEVIDIVQGVYGINGVDYYEIRA